jgi:hypothetical protein
LALQKCDENKNLERFRVSVKNENALGPWRATRKAAPNLNIPATHASASMLCGSFGASFIHETNRLASIQDTPGQCD